MSYLTRQQIISGSTTSLISHYGHSVEIEIKRSNYNRIPCIVFRSMSKGLVSALAAHHVAKLSRMAPTWKPWTSGVRYDKTTDGLAYTVISLKGLTPKVLREWVNAATSRGFVVNLEEGILPQVQQPQTELEEVIEKLQQLVEIANEADVWEQPIETEVVEEIPMSAKQVVTTHKPFGLPGKVATNAELKAVLRAQGKDTRGNKAALLARL